jgi:hypothetical protein
VALCVAGWFGWQPWLDRSGGTPVQVVLTPMKGTTGDTILDKSLTQVLRMDLAQSPYVSVVPVSTVQATFTQMMRVEGMRVAHGVEACFSNRASRVRHIDRALRRCSASPKPLFPVHGGSRKSPATQVFHFLQGNPYPGRLVAVILSRNLMQVSGSMHGAEGT